MKFYKYIENLDWQTLASDERINYNYGDDLFEVETGDCYVQETDDGIELNIVMYHTNGCSSNDPSFEGATKTIVLDENLDMIREELEIF
jgi:hypothetical protein